SNPATLLGRLRGIQLTQESDRGVVGNISDAAATSDTGSFSQMSFIKRALQYWSTLLGVIGNSTDAGVNASTQGGLLARLRGTHASIESISTSSTDTSGSIGALTNLPLAQGTDNGTLISAVKGTLSRLVNLNTYLGAASDTASTTDTDSTSFAAKFKYFLTRLTVLIELQTNGTQKSIVRSGSKGTAVASDITSTNVDTNTQALDVSIKGTSTIKQEQVAVTVGAPVVVALGVNTASAAGSCIIPVGCKYMYIGNRGTQPIFYRISSGGAAAPVVNAAPFISQNGFIIEDQIESIPRGQEIRFISSAASTIIVEFRS
ncbi:MAG: hypothetical protein ACRDBG_13490, partial [Waterburya sp.]